MEWSELKAKHIGEGLEFKYCYENGRLQIYILDGADAYICYLPTQITLDSPAFISDNKTNLQADLTDFETNHKSDATETNGVKD